MRTPRIMLGAHAGALLALLAALGVRAAPAHPNALGQDRAVTASHRTYLSIGGRRQYRPAEVEIIPDFRFERVRWHSWGVRRARGSGTAKVFDDDALRMLPYPATVYLGGLRRCGRVRIFTRISWRFTGDIPLNYARRGYETRASWCAKR